jgi:hypothetical protein
MKLLIPALVALSSIAAAEPAPPAQQTLPAEPAYSAVLVYQCGAAVVIVATMESGTVLTFDMRSRISWVDQEAWFLKAKTHIMVEAKCMVIPGQDVAT